MPLKFCDSMSLALRLACKHTRIDAEVRFEGTMALIHLRYS